MAGPSAPSRRDDERAGMHATWTAIRPHRWLGALVAAAAIGLATAGCSVRRVAPDGGGAGPATTEAPGSAPAYYAAVQAAHPELGCPKVMVRSDVTFQRFERGLLIWRKDPKPSTIYALDAERGFWQAEPDPGGTPEARCPEAKKTGGLGPIFGFGTLWCEPWGWRSQLRQPIAKEENPGTLPIEELDHGTILTLGSAGGFILRDDGTWEAFTPDADPAR